MLSESTQAALAETDVSSNGCRYFILKSHDEADLRKSVETGVWATQTHNEVSDT